MSNIHNPPTAEASTPSDGVSSGDDRPEAPATTVMGSGWTDSRRHLWLLGLVGPLLPFVGWGLAEATGVSLFWWTAPLVVFVVVPIWDLLGGRDSANPPEAIAKDLDSDRYYRWITWLYVPLQFLALVAGAWLWSAGGLSVFAALGLAVSVGTVAGLGINAAHEMGHKSPQMERWLSKVALSQSFYGHFYTEHNRGHHKNVSTPEDPASSRLGENFYAFWPRTVVGSLRSAISIERTTGQRVGRSFWSIRNDTLNAWLMSVVVFAALLSIFGVGLLPFLVIQAVVGFSLLEVVNYVEHYGLLRERRADGRYVRCEPVHSWNANNTATNLLLYQLQRHSDHHANPLRRYQSLRHFEEAPQLPTGYAGMILLALVPPLWRRVMDPRVVEHYDGDPSRANLHPRRRRKLEAVAATTG